VAAAADPNSDVRAAALHALGQCRAPEAVTPLLFALSDASPYLARIATDALIQIGKPAVPGLIRALEADAHSQVRANAARALALIGDTSAIPALYRALEDDSVVARHWAEEGLDRMGLGQVYFKP
jgi:HEAT repeat protein